MVGPQSAMGLPPVTSAFLLRGLRSILAWVRTVTTLVTRIAVTPSIDEHT
jgi:hypothetical protein